jgi:hypothetical protein
MSDSRVRYHAADKRGGHPISPFMGSLATGASPGRLPASPRGELGTEGDGRAPDRSRHRSRIDPSRARARLHERGGPCAARTVEVARELAFGPARWATGDAQGCVRGPSRLGRGCFAGHHHGGRIDRHLSASRERWGSALPRRIVRSCRSSSTRVSSRFSPSRRLIALSELPSSMAAWRRRFDALGRRGKMPIWASQARTVSS